MEEGQCSTIIFAILVRLFFLLHSILAVCRVAQATGEDLMWCLTLANFLLIAEGIIVLKYNGGIEWKCWCPCFLFYLSSTLPAIWLLQLSQNDKLRAAASGEIENNVRQIPSPITIFGILEYIDTLMGFKEATWIVVMQEVLVYFTVFGHLLLPRKNISKVKLADRVLLYLAMASDIMEFYAVFDEQVVQEDHCVTYAVLTIWSISLLHFVPILTLVNEKGELKSPVLVEKCTKYKSEVIETVCNIILQDVPFLVVRLYIMIKFKLVTFSLLFFVLKNFFSVFLLLYRIHCLGNNNEYSIERLIMKKETPQGDSYLVKWSVLDVEKYTWELASSLTESFKKQNMSPADSLLELNDASEKIKNVMCHRLSNESLSGSVEIDMPLDLFRYLFSTESSVTVSSKNVYKLSELNGVIECLAFPIKITPILRKDNMNEGDLKVHVVEKWSFKPLAITK